MNTQQQEINVVQPEAQWQAPELVELGNVSNMTQNNNIGHRSDGSFAPTS